MAVNPVVQTHRQEMAEVCRRFGVERLEVFGSANRSDFNQENSDVDFIVRFREPEKPGYADRYWGFAQSLEQLLGRRVDLLTERSLKNPLFIRQISADRAAVYGD